MSLTDTHITVRRTHDTVTVKVKHSLGWFHTRTKRFRFAVVEEHERPNWYRAKRLLGLVDFQSKATLVPLDKREFTNYDYDRDKTFTVDESMEDVLRQNGYDYISQSELYDTYEKHELSGAAGRAWRNYERSQGLSPAGQRLLTALKHDVEDAKQFDGEVGKQKAVEAASNAIKLCLVVGDDMDAEAADECDVIYGTRLGNVRLQ